VVLNQGYQPTTIVGQLRLIARLNRWLLRKDYDLGGLDERVLEHFQKCEQKKRRTAANGARITLRRLLGVLREAGVAPICINLRRFRLRAPSEGDAWVG
jgi:hypothetical protein